MNYFRSMLMVVIGCFAIGCGGSGPDPAAVNASRIMIYPPTGDPLPATGGSIGRTQISETLAVQIKDSRLLVNDKDYGAVKGGDKVNIEAGNVVKVNGEVRQPGR